MLAFFVYARFFLPTTRRRLGRQSRPTRVMRFRHAVRDSVRKRDDDDHDDEEEEEEEFLQREREKREKKGKKKNVTRLFEEKERNVSKLSSLVRTKKGHATFRKLLLLIPISLNPNPKKENPKYLSI